MTFIWDRNGSHHFFPKTTNDPWILSKTPMSKPHTREHENTWDTGKTHTSSIYIYSTSTYWFPESWWPRSCPGYGCWTWLVPWHHTNPSWKRGRHCKTSIRLSSEIRHWYNLISICNCKNVNTPDYMYVKVNWEALNPESNSVYV